MLTHRTTTRVPRRLRTAALFIALAALPACGHARPGQSDASEPAFIYFTNESLAQADVFASSPGITARRLGTVMAGRTDTIRVPLEITTRGTAQLYARLLASSATPSSGTVAIHPGDRLAVRLPLDQRTLIVLPAS